MSVSKGAVDSFASGEASMLANLCSCQCLRRKEATSIGVPLISDDVISRNVPYEDEIVNGGSSVEEVGYKVRTSDHLRLERIGASRT
jgi:hypothetical protein